MINKIQKTWKLLPLVLVLFILSFAFIINNSDAQTGSIKEIKGYAWSSNIGWISFNSTNPNAGTGASYKVTLDSQSGAFDGYAWSSNIGWISFTPANLSNCPNNTGNPSNCYPKINKNTGEVSGWARACAGTITGNCSSSVSRTDGWDGWIELAGTNHPSLGGGGVTYNTNTGALTGKAWDTVMGWIDFDATSEAIGSNVNLLVKRIADNSYTDGITISINDLFNIRMETQSVDRCDIDDGNWDNLSEPSIIRNFIRNSQTNNTTARFNTIGDKILKVVCSKPDNTKVYDTVSIRVNDTNSPGGSCPAPINANKCDISLSIGDSIIHASVNECPNNENEAQGCEFFCKDGFILKDNRCVNPSNIREE